MKSLKVLLMCCASVALFGFPALAGEGKKCAASAQECVDKMAGNFEKRGWMGVEIEWKDEKMFIKKVINDSPAAKAGMMEGDMLVALNGVKYGQKNEAAMKKAYKAVVPGNKVTYTVLTNGKKRDLKVVLGKMPAEVRAKWVGHHMLEYHAALAVN